MIKKLHLAIFLLTLSAVAVTAQNAPEQAIISSQDQFFDIKKRSLELERMKRETNKRPVSEDFTPKFPKIKEDFEQIQKANNDLFQLINSQTPINYAAVLKLVSEINQRADRLRSNLFTDEFTEKKKAKNKQQNTAQSQDIKIPFSVLDKAVNSFAHNPMFQNLNLIKLDDSLKAEKDLETIITISSAIKEKAKKIMGKDSENQRNTKFK